MSQIQMDSTADVVEQSCFNISVAGFEQNMFAFENYDLLHQTIRTKLTQNLGMEPNALTDYRKYGLTIGR